ncbi:MAG: hypothetical protein ACHBN1_34050 [Heteroscytonema crispum UTEX LB 1556]
MAWKPRQLLTVGEAAQRTASPSCPLPHQRTAGLRPRWGSMNH